MTETTKQISTEMNKNVDRLRALRDDVRVQMHLARMEAKDRWRELEPSVTALIDEADKGATDLARGVVTDAINALEKLRASIA